MIGNYLNTEITLYIATSIDDAGDITYGNGKTLMAKVESHATLEVTDGLNRKNTLTVYFEQRCPTEVLIQIGTAKHPSKSVTNYYRFGKYAYTKVELE